VTNEQILRLKEIAYGNSETAYDRAFWVNRDNVKALIDEVERLSTALKAAGEAMVRGNHEIERLSADKPIAATKTAEWSAMLRAEIAAQELLINRMHDDHPDTQGNGIMGQLRAERLGLLEQLLKFEPKRASDECRRGPSCGMLDGAWECNCPPLPALNRGAGT
jgi:hypothetical protein